MRNIINTDEISFFLHDISKQKKLDNFPLIQTWLFSNVRKHIINHSPIDETVELNSKPEILEYMQTYGINKPVHFLKLDHQLKDKINHVLDFLKSEYGTNRDVSKISFPQSIVSAEKWLNQKLKKLSQEEDIIYTKPFLDNSALDKNIYTSPIDTITSPDYFSYSAGDTHGRFVALAMIH